jgi:hypothetical protein
LTFVKKIEPTPDLFKLGVLEKIVNMPEELLIFSEMSEQSSSEIFFRASNVEIDARLEFSFGEFARFDSTGLLHIQDQNVTPCIFLF